jgi:hypothetical protein
MPKIINDLQRARKVYGSVYRAPVRASLQTTAESDAAVLKLDWKESVRVASTANVTLPPGSVTGPVDGITLANGERILLKDQSTTTENGIYVVNVAGGTWDRADDAIPSNTLTCGATVYVEEGSVNQYSKWILQTTNALIPTQQVWVTFGVATPAAPTNSVQYNNAGSFGGSANFTFNGSTVYLTGSFSQGLLSNASGLRSHAEGRSTISSGFYSHAEGNQTTALGASSHAEGDNTNAKSIYSHAEGINTTTVGSGSHAEGNGSTAGALGYSARSVLSGLITLESSYGDVSAEFTSNYVTFDDSLGGNNYGHTVFKISSVGFVAGTTQITLQNNSVTTTTPLFVGVQGVSQPSGANQLMGPSSHSEGYQTIADGMYAHAEGYQAVSSGQSAHAEGEGSISIGNYSHAEGQYTLASGSHSHAEGKGSQAIGDFSHAAGNQTIAAGDGSRAIGYESETRGIYSYAAGRHTIASGSYQHVIGKYNIRNNDFSLFVVGNGSTNSARSDILRVNSSTMELTGSFTPGVDNAYELGSANYRWAHVYTADLHLRNDRGDWTLIEEPEYLTIRNNTNGQRYKLLMEPIEE